MTRKHTPDTEKTTHFGFKTVPETEKAARVRDVFDSVASRYDLMNDLMSLGVHRLWKAAFIDRLNPRPGMRLVDVGGGTGDIAFRFLQRGGGHVTVCDVNNAMLEVGRKRAVDRGILNGVQWMAGDAEKLPVADNSFDAFTIAFCIRNVTHIDKALKEARRALKPGGHFLCLEFSHVLEPILQGLYDAYSFKALPALGEFIAGDREAYQYLAESIRRFPDQDEFSAMIAEAGLERVKCQNLSGGVAAIHSAWRL